ncbi:MAG: serine peptidase [Methylomonas sp.]|nr:MAG: serine peptidase [Methylomonas sp.]
MENSYFIPNPEPPRSISRNLISPFDLEIDRLIEAPRARSQFNLDGSGLSVAVLDTGLRVTHKCFEGRVISTMNFTNDDNGNIDIVTDYNGHGTNVTGIIAADSKDERRGIAPRSNVIPLKVLPAPSFDPILNALQWVYDNTERLNITVANLSLGAPGINYMNDTQAGKDYPELLELLNGLVTKRVAVVIAAGNDYFRFQQEGMTVPAIFRQVISVGAVYDASFGPRAYRNGASAISTHADQITPFSQRLAKETSPDCYTDVFSPGAAATSAGAAHDDDTSIQDGTSQAAPTVAGVILLLQQYYIRVKGTRPSVSLLQDMLRTTSSWIFDGDDEDDNVKHTNHKYPRINAFQSLVALHKAIQLGTI